MFSDQYRFIFVHINKTGGTSIETIFQPAAEGVWDGMPEEASPKGFLNLLP